MSSDYKLQLEGTPQKYITKIAPDVINGTVLVKGTKNVLISDDGTIESRSGKTLMGQAGGLELPIVWSSDPWITNTGAERNFRSYFNNLQVFYKDNWHTIATGFGNNVKFCGKEWFDRTEGKDKFIFVNGTQNIYSWLGGIAEVESNTSSTLKKKMGTTAPATKVLTLSDITGSQLRFGYSYSLLNPSGSYNCIQGTVGFPSFYDKGFRDGDQISISNLTGAFSVNNGNYTIASVNRDQNEIILTGGFVQDGIVTQGSNNCTIVGTTQGINSSETFGQARFATSGVKKFYMLGVEYTYTGGEHTDTLTGITPAMPIVGAGTLIFSSVMANTFTNKGDIPASTPNFDKLDISLNQVYLGAQNRREVWISKNSNFMDYSYTAPVRKFGEGGTAVLDQNVTAIYTVEDGLVNVSCGKSLWYDIYTESVTSNGVDGEEVRVKRAKVAYGQGAVSQTGITNTKNGIIFVSHEPSIDYLSRVKTYNSTENTAISDDIKPDLNSYDLSDAVAKYYKNYFLALLPKENILLMYDIENDRWQPPQVSPHNTMSIIEGRLVFHSNLKNESYYAFEGDTDNGVAIDYEVVFPYKNGGARDKYKIYQGYFIEMKITEGTDTMYWEAQYGYRGSIGIDSDVFGSGDGFPNIERPPIPSGMGGSSIGTRSVGTFFTNDDDIDYLKYRRIFPVKISGKEFFEAQVRIKADKLKTKFKIIAYGFDLMESGSHNTNLIKIN